MPAPIKIELSAAEKKQLAGYVKSRKTPLRLIERSKIVLLGAKGIPNYKIARELKIDVNKVVVGATASRRQGLQVLKKIYLEEEMREARIQWRKRLQRSFAKNKIKTQD